MIMDTIHVLEAGVAWCGLKGVPSSWPPGHRWVGFNDGDLKPVTCRKCLEVMRTRKRLDIDPDLPPNSAHNYEIAQKKGWKYDKDRRVYVDKDAEAVADEFGQPLG